VGAHLIKSWATTQPTITLSSGEAELYGVARAAANGLGYLSLLADLGIKLRLRVWTDSTASQGMCGRQGLGKVRHLDVQELWIQQRVRNQDFDLLKVWGEENPGDLFTKAGLSESRIRELLKLLNCEFREGRAKSAPALRQEGGTKSFMVDNSPPPRSQWNAPRKSRAASTVKPVSTAINDGITPQRQRRNLQKSPPTTAVRPLPQRPRWADLEDSEEEQTCERGERLARQALRLPHQRQQGWPGTPAVPAYPEADEPDDILVEEGLAIGRASAGRRALPGRLRALDAQASALAEEGRRATSSPPRSE
jgi:hypothetical protein